MRGWWPARDLTGSAALDPSGTWKGKGGEASNMKGRFVLFEKRKGQGVR